MRKYFHTALALAASGLLAFTMSAFAQNGSPGQSGATAAASGNSAQQSNQKLDRTDENFLKKAAEGGLAEVELGNLAVEKATSNDVKQFAQKMVDDHTKANQQLQQLAASKGVTLPDKPSMSQRAEKLRLEKTSAPKFDRAYMDYMVKDHTNDVNEFRDEVQSAKDSSVRDFANKTLPTLENHLRKAESVDTNVKTGKAEKASTSQTATNTQKPKAH